MLWQAAGMGVGSPQPTCSLDASRLPGVASAGTDRGQLPPWQEPPSLVAGMAANPDWKFFLIQHRKPELVNHFAQ